MLDQPNGNGGAIDEYNNGLGDGVIDPTITAAAPEPGKRGRGRPRKSEPASGNSGSGKPAGTAPARAKKEKASSRLDIGVISFCVKMVGSFVANATKKPSLALDDEEVKPIAERAEHVASFYDVPVSPVTQAWIALAGVVGMTYSAKISALKLAKELQADSGK